MSRPVNAGTQRHYDKALVLHENATPVTAALEFGKDAAGVTITPVDIGTARAEFEVVLDAGVVDVASNDEEYNLDIIGLDSDVISPLGDYDVLARIHYGGVPTFGATKRTVTGIQQDRVPAVNERNLKTYRYLACVLRASGTSPAFQYRCFITKRK